MLEQSGIGHYRHQRCKLEYVSIRVESIADIAQRYAVATHAMLVFKAQDHLSSKCLMLRI